MLTTEFMRVAHVCGAFSLLSETFIYDTVTELENQGIECHVLTLDHVNEDNRPFSNVNVVAPSRRNILRIARKGITYLGIADKERYFWPLAQPRIRQTLLALQPDVIHAHFGQMGALTLPIAKELGIPAIVSFHGFDAFALPLQKNWIPLLKQVLSHANAITAVSAAMKSRLLQLGSTPDNTHIIHVGKRLSDFPFQPRRGDPIRRWISVGRLIEKKGHFDCIEAFKSVAQDFPDASLEIIGDGEAKGALKHHILKSGLQSRISLPGPLPHRTVQERMQASDAFILCSKTATNGDSEGIPTVLMEAQAIGLPCVSTTHSGIPEVIPMTNHWLLANEGDSGSIANCMRALMHCSAEEISQITYAGRLKIERDFSLTNETEKLINIYDAIIATTRMTYSAAD